MKNKIIASIILGGLIATTVMMQYKLPVSAVGIIAVICIVPCYLIIYLVSSLMRGKVFGKNSSIALMLSLIYWVPSTMILYDIINGGGNLFSNHLDDVLMPGYIVGFILGYAGGGFFATVGQVLTLLLLFILLKPLVGLFKVFTENKN